MTSEQIASLAGIILSLAFAYVPGLADKYNALGGTQKRLIMGAVLIVGTAGALVYKCQLLTACYSAGWEEYLSALISALISNQAAYLISPKPAAKS